MERISWKLIALLALALVLVACGRGGPSAADIDATVEARLAQERAIEATVKARVKEEVAVQLISATPLHVNQIIPTTALQSISTVVPQSTSTGNTS
jgi:predicted small lipoprotein YifL